MNLLLPLLLVVGLAVNGESATANKNGTAPELVRLCTCPEAAECVRHAGFERVPACKLECAPAHLEAYVRGGGDAEPLAGCFEDARVDARALNRCVREHVDSICAGNTNGTGPTSYIRRPDYTTIYDTVSDAIYSESKLASSSSFINKVRSVFTNFRGYQRCVNNCVKRHCVECFNERGCAIQLSAAAAKKDRALTIFADCSHQNEFRNARAACRCLIRQHSVHQLIGVCPLFSEASKSLLVAAGASRN